MLVSVSAARVMSRNAGALVTVSRHVSAMLPATAITRTVPARRATASGCGRVSMRAIVVSEACQLIAGL